MLDPPFMVMVLIKVLMIFAVMVINQKNRFAVYKLSLDGIN